jgi:acyl carrier protein
MKEQLIAILQKVSKKTAVPADDESLFESGFLDSFALTDMVSELEEAFQVKIPDADLTPRKFDTVEKILAYVEGLR